MNEMHFHCSLDRDLKKHHEIIWTYTGWRQAVWSIMVDAPRVRIKKPNVLNFVTVIERTS